SSLIEEEVNKFWREHITILNPELLRFLLKEELSRPIIFEIIGKHLGGQRFIDYNPENLYSLSVAEQERALEELLELEKKSQAFIDNLHQEVHNSKVELTKICNENRYAKKTILPLIDKPEEFLDAL